MHRRSLSRSQDVRFHCMFGRLLKSWRPPAEASRPLPPLSRRQPKSTMAKPQIIVIKKVQGHGGHHGGAWKVAYADFVTAMMALFIVLWLLNTSDHTRKVIAGYFNDPLGKKTESGTDR